MYEYFIEDMRIMIVTEVCDGGELFDRASDKNITEKDAAVLMKQILLSLTYLHNIGIAHRDIKPENFLFENKDDNCLEIKMIDFGLSKVLNS
jgi:calcium-dependent protein kinase